MGRESRAKSRGTRERGSERKAVDDPVDPPVEPMKGSVRWFESGPQPIRDEYERSVLMVRVGLAINALSVQRAAAVAGSAPGSACRMRNVLCALVTSSALLHETLRLIGGGMPTLRQLASTGGGSPSLLQRIGQLCAGTHPASALLGRARNQVGFHWDEEPIGEAMRQFGNNKRLVWVESDAEGEPVYRLAADVLALALFPEVDATTADPVPSPALDQAMKDLGDAIALIVEFLGKASLGHLKAIGAVAQPSAVR
jgi:hypothetical protein